jgi:amylosucrase
MEKIRTDHPVFDPEADVWLPDAGNNHVLAIGRYYRGEQLIALFNFSGQPQTALLRDEKTYTDLMNGQEDNAYEVRLESGDFRWLLHTF